ncbi:hypothetical protein [Pantoea agglomerans]|uniref:hypothetical protein n=1 Tax=Enterobacter agglomerans TaxID=549 RepID=UPI0037C9E29E
MLNAASASRMAEKVAFLLAASFSVISICCSLRSSVALLTGVSSLSKKSTASPSFVSARFSSSVLYIMLHHIPGFSQSDCRSRRYLPKDSGINGNVCDGMLNRKFMHRTTGSRPASGSAEKRRYILRRVSAGQERNSAGAAILLPGPAPFSLVATLNYHHTSLTF